MNALSQSTRPKSAGKSGLLNCADATPAADLGGVRWRVARRIERARQCGFWWHSPRQVARQIGVPDSSLRYDLQQHRQRCQNHRAARPLVEFLETPAGIEFLQRLFICLHLVFGEAHDGGLRNLGWFLQLSGLDEFLPASFGAQQNFATRLETLLAEFGREEEQRLAAQMPPREITVAEDETFHPQICLVAMEPVSGYLLLEEYAAQRDTATWTGRLDEQLRGWSVTVCQVVSDEAAALIAHAEQSLGAHHSPDLFHVQHETVQATSLALAGQTRRDTRRRSRKPVSVRSCSSAAVPAWRVTTGNSRCGITPCIVCRRAS